jgi:hypothetical protein
VLATCSDRRGIFLFRGGGLILVDRPVLLRVLLSGEDIGKVGQETYCYDADEIGILRSMIVNDGK